MFDLRLYLKRERGGPSSSQAAFGLNEKPRIGRDTGSHAELLASPHLARALRVCSRRSVLKDGDGRATQLPLLGFGQRKATPESYTANLLFTQSPNSPAGSDLFQPRETGETGKMPTDRTMFPLADPPAVSPGSWPVSSHPPAPLPGPAAWSSFYLCREQTHRAAGAEGAAEPVKRPELALRAAREAAGP